MAHPEQIHMSRKLYVSQVNGEGVAGPERLRELKADVRIVAAMEKLALERHQHLCEETLAYCKLSCFYISAQSQ